MFKIGRFVPVVSLLFVSLLSSNGALANTCYCSFRVVGTEVLNIPNTGYPPMPPTCAQAIGCRQQCINLLVAGAADQAAIGDKRCVQGIPIKVSFRIGNVVPYCPYEFTRYVGAPGDWVTYCFPGSTMDGNNRCFVNNYNAEARYSWNNLSCVKKSCPVHQWPGPDDRCHTGLSGEVIPPEVPNGDVGNSNYYIWNHDMYKRMGAVQQTTPFTFPKEGAWGQTIIPSQTGNCYYTNPPKECR